MRMNAEIQEPYRIVGLKIDKSTEHITTIGHAER